MNIDQLIDEREQARQCKNYKRCDEIRSILDCHLVFVFDAPWGQQVFYLTEKYFARKPEDMTHRKFVEKRMQDDSRAERLLNAWLVTTNAA